MANYITNTCGLFGSDVITKQARLVKQAIRLGVLPLSLYYYPVETDSAEQLSSRLDGILSGFSFGDNLILQMPTMLGERYEHALMEKINVFRQSSNSKLIIAINDVNADRNQTVKLINDYYNQADSLIVPSAHYGQYLQQLGLENANLFYLRVYDQESTQFNMPPVKPNPQLSLLTTNSTVEQAARDLGLSVNGFSEDQITPLEQRAKLNQQGGWGIIWPQNDAEEFTQQMSPTLEFNQLILAGLPVIVKAGSAVARLVKNHHLGIVSDQLPTALQKIQDLEPAEYEKIQFAVHQLGTLVAKGTFTDQCLMNAFVAVQLRKGER